MADQNQRRFMRLALVVPVRYINKETSAEGHAKMRDVNEQGIGLISDHEIPLGTNLELWLHLPDGANVCIQGTVVWVSQAEAEKYFVGIKLLEGELKPKQLIARVMQSVNRM